VILLNKANPHLFNEAVMKQEFFDSDKFLLSAGKPEDRVE